MSFFGPFVGGESYLFCCGREGVVCFISPSTIFVNEKGNYDYVDHARSMVDNLIVVGEVLSDSEIILAVLEGLRPEYSSFVTSVTTKFDHNMSFIDFQSILMDLELNDASVEVVMAPIAANVVTTSSSKGGVSNVRKNSCQICNRPGYGAINCYNRFNAQRFPPTHNRKLVYMYILFL